MTYHCSAIFAKGDQLILNAARQKWKGCLARYVDKPFSGVAFADPGADRCYPLVFNTARQEEHEKIAKSMRDDLLSWSEKFSSTIFVFIQVDCFGGVCEFAGFVVQNGIKLGAHEGKDALKKLLAYLDVDIDESDNF